MKYSRAFAFAVAALATAVFTLDAEAAKKHGSSAASIIDNAMHSARVERGYVCYSDHYHYGSGSGSTRARAEASAISSWSAFVDLEYGSAWANFRRAGSKKMSCSQGSTGWDCSVEARPCRGI